MNPQAKRMEFASDESYCLFGTEALLKRLQALTQEIEGVRKAEDIEYIHRMRVASRRLRSAFALFEECLPRKKFPGWQKQIRRVTRALGAARDTDVQIDALARFLDSLSEVEQAQGVPPYHAGIERLLLRLRQRRQALQADVLSALDQLEASRIADEMGLVLRQQLVQARLNRVDGQSLFVYEQACLRISVQLEEMLAYESCVHQPEHVAELHAMRIAAKRLRYTMEVFAPLYPDELKGPLHTVRDIQDIIGDIHDCDVWVQYLPQFLEEERARTLEYFGHVRSFRRLAAGILYMQQDRQQHRASRYREFAKFWQRTQKQAVWENLRQTLQAALTGERPAPGAAQPAMDERQSSTVQEPLSSSDSGQASNPQSATALRANEQPVTRENDQ
jgi:CHAD domain-containing protein